MATGKRVVCIEGDGSFAMNSYELESVRRLDLPIKVFVIRNGGYASIVGSQRRAGYNECVPSVPDPYAFLEIGKMDCHGLSSMAAALRSEGPEVIPIDADCSLSHRMRTVPPGKPEDIEVLKGGA